jgi:hypothetical protein
MSDGSKLTGEQGEGAAPALIYQALGTTISQPRNEPKWSLMALTSVTRA